MFDYWSDKPEAEIALRLTRSIPVATFVVKTAPERGSVRFVFLSDPWLRLTGLTREVVMGDPAAVFRRIHRPDYPRFLRASRRAALRGKSLQWEGRLEVAGGIRWCSVESTPFALPDGGIAWEGVLIDVTRRRRMEERLRSGERLWQQTLDNIPTPILCARVGERIMPFFVNRHFAEGFGYRLSDVQRAGEWLRRAYPEEEYRARVREAWQALVRRVANTPGMVEHLEARLCCADGSFRDVLIFGAVVEGRLLVSFIDISERKEAEARDHHLARHDRLTGLPNRVRFDERLQAALALAGCRGGGLALLFVDLDRFKQVNDRHGHGVGDLLLEAVGQRLRGLVRDGDVPARLGGDELVVLAESITSPGSALGLASRLLLALEQPFEIAGIQVSISASIGIAMYPEHGEDPLTLTRHADAAMYLAKTSGGGRVVMYGPDVADSPADTGSGHESLACG